jgi:hypothetical protein
VSSLTADTNSTGGGTDVGGAAGFTTATPYTRSFHKRSWRSSGVSRGPGDVERDRERVRGDRERERERDRDRRLRADVGDGERFGERLGERLGEIALDGDDVTTGERRGERGGGDERRGAGERDRGGGRVGAPAIGSRDENVGQRGGGERRRAPLPPSTSRLPYMPSPDAGTSTGGSAL